MRSSLVAVLLLFFAWGMALSRCPLPEGALVYDASAVRPSTFSSFSPPSPPPGGVASVVSAASKCALRASASLEAVKKKVLLLQRALGQVARMRSEASDIRTELDSLSARRKGVLRDFWRRVSSLELVGLYAAVVEGPLGERDSVLEARARRLLVSAAVSALRSYLEREVPFPGGEGRGMARVVRGLYSDVGYYNGRKRYFTIALVSARAVPSGAPLEAAGRVYEISTPRGRKRLLEGLSGVGPYRDEVESIAFVWSSEVLAKRKVFLRRLRSYVADAKGRLRPIEARESSLRERLSSLERSFSSLERRMGFSCRGGISSCCKGFLRFLNARLDGAVKRACALLSDAPLYREFKVKGEISGELYRGYLRLKGLLKEKQLVKGIYVAPHPVRLLVYAEGTSGEFRVLEVLEVRWTRVK